MSLVTRASNIILRPNSEWPVIAAEPATPASILVGYVLPLAAIGPIASFIGFSVVGVGIPFLGTYRVGLATGLTNAVVSYVFTLLGILLLAAIVNVLAPSFGAPKSWPGALKVTAYSTTPSLLAGILLIFPPLGILGIVAGIYGIFLLFTGLPIVMGTSKEKAPMYVLGVVGCGIVLAVLFGAVSAAVRAGSYAMTGGYGGESTGSTDTRAAQTVAASMLGNALGGSAANQQAAQQAVNAVASAAAQADAAKTSGDSTAQTAAGLGMLEALVTGGKRVVVVPRAELQSLLPDRFRDMQRSDAQSESRSFAGLKGSKAAAHYQGTGGSVQIEISDLGNVGGLAALAGTAANLTESENNEGYEKNVEVGGQTVHETWNDASKLSELFAIVDSRFAVGVSGRGVDMATALEAFQTLDLRKLRDMVPKRP